MKRILMLLAVLIFLSGAALAQGDIKYPNSNPTGTTCGGYTFALYQGTLYMCQGGLFAVMPTTPSGNANFVLYPSSSPSGNACSATNGVDPLAQVYSGTVYTCQAGAYTAVAGGTGSGNVSNSGTPTAGQTPQWVDATHIKGVSWSQDCSISTTGVVTCTKTNNVAFATSATTDTTNATNISSGTLSNFRLPSAISVTSLTASGAVTGGTIVGNLTAWSQISAILTGVCNGTTTVFGDGSCNTPAGGGNVSNSGTPTSGQLGIWTGATTLKGATASQDCTVSSTGVFTCTKTNNVAFAASATTDTTNASNISSGTLAAALGGAGAVNGALKGNGSGAVSQAACADLSNAAASCSTDTTNASNIASGTLNIARFPSFTNHAFVFGSGAAGSPNFLASPTANGQYTCGFNIVASAAVDPTCLLAGVATNAQTGTTYTILYSDRLGYISFSNASPIAVTLPQAGSTGFTSNFAFAACNIGAGTATITPTTSTISYSDGVAYTSAASSLPLTTGQCVSVYSDNANYFAVLHAGNASKSTVAANTGFALPSGAGASPTGAGNCSYDTTTKTQVCGDGTTTRHGQPVVYQTNLSNIGIPATCLTGARCYNVILGKGGSATVEANVGMPFGQAATMTKICVRIGATQGAVNTTFTLRDTTTATDTSLAVTINSGTTAQQVCATGSAAVNATDDYSIENFNSTGTASATILGIYMSGVN